MVLLPVMGHTVSNIVPRSSSVTTPPLDSAEAERVRVWLPVARTNKCRVTIDILDDSGQVIRHLVDKLLSKGYHNFYWDKKDDSGRWVEPGEYAYVINDCGKKRFGQVTALFKQWERESEVFPPEETWSTKIRYLLKKDSALVTLRVYNTRGKLVETVAEDSLMMKGEYEFHWEPPPLVPRGRYTVEVIIGDMKRVVEIRYRKERK